MILMRAECLARNRGSRISERGRCRSAIAEEAEKGLSDRHRRPLSTPCGSTTECSDHRTIDVVAAGQIRPTQRNVYTKYLTLPFYLIHPFPIVGNIAVLFLPPELNASPR